LVTVRSARAGFAKISKLYPRPKSQDDMALALEGFAGLGKQHRAHLAKVSGFDVKLLEEAVILAIRLRERSGEALLAQGSRDASEPKRARQRKYHQGTSISCRSLARRGRSLRRARR
jgi:hypothetical protein